ncbi:MAG: hypothetical protein U0136_18235 [Bdellovibrionota bacterium]
MFLELDNSDAKALGVFSAGVIVFLCALTFLCGVSPLVTSTVLLAILIIVITAVGCSMHLRAIEHLEEAEGLEKMRERIQLHMALINEVLSAAEPRVSDCEAALDAGGESFEHAAENVASARRIVSALARRLDELVGLSLAPGVEATLKAFAIVESRLAIPSGAAGGEKPADETLRQSIPDLEPHLWRDTLDMLLLSVEKQIRSKEEMAA